MTNQVTRTFVEKRPGFDIEAQQMLSDLQENLGLRSITELRLFNRYDISGLNQDELAKAKKIIFSEPNADRIYDEALPEMNGCKSFAMEYLPGQYDQRADSAAQCAQLLTQGERPQVLTAKVICLFGNISDDDLQRVQHYIINPVESRLASDAKPESLEMQSRVPDDVAVVNGFTGWSEGELKKYFDSMGFAMTMADLRFCRDYFRDEEHRDPFVTELRVIDTYWSDHCRHTTFQTRLNHIEIEKGALAGTIEAALQAYYDARDEVYGKTDRPICLMDMAVMGMKLLKKRGMIPDLDISEEINACSIQVPVVIDGKTEQWLVQFKNETHNHPTEIEPFGGAATCLGGAIRDPLSGRSYVYQAMRVTGSGDPLTRFEDTLPGKLPSKKITRGAAHGYSSYGNQIGLATGQVTEFYDNGYMAKRMEIGAVIGASPKENVVRGVPSEGDIIVLLGGRTGRDGCGGATGSSKAHTEQSIETCGAEVQKGNPPTERKIQRLFRKKEVARMIKRCNDFGAGGVCVAIGELADGLRIDLDRVPKKYEGLDGTELAISESQERMAVVLAPDDVDRFIEESKTENLEATVVAVVTKENRLCMNWRGSRIVDLSRDFLNTNGVTQDADAMIACPDVSNDYRTAIPACLNGLSGGDAWKKNLARLEVCSQKGLSERFDSSIGAATVLMPFAGTYQLTPEEAMVAKIPLEHGQTDTATAMSFGFIPGISRFSPMHGAAWAVTESLARLAAVGADPLTARLTFQEYFERLHDDPARWGKPTAALLGAFLAQREFGVPSIGGKDSMSGSFEQLDVPPTLVSFAVAMTTASGTVSAAFTEAGRKVCFIPMPTDSETHLPDFAEAKKLFAVVASLQAEHKITAAAVVHDGGLSAALAKMCFGNRVGFRFSEKLDAQTLFAPLCGSLILEGDILDELKATGISAKLLGETTDEGAIAVNGEILPLEELAQAWLATLEPVFPNRAKTNAALTELKLFTQHSQSAPAIKAAKPKVFIPAFPGTNCEVDSARAFEAAGAEPEILIVRNLSSSDIEETIDAMVKKIDAAQIIMLPGGFSGGDEPDGSGKFIATTLRNPRVADAVMRLLNERDGLMLGICNGFQALIKLGLVPNGTITEIGSNDPTLTFNTIGRHVSRMAYTRITSVKSPWFAGVNAGDVFAVPVSHGEGRFVADKATIETLAANGQIATQYCAPDGSPSLDITWNPNGSEFAIEGITSPDGRILGKMGHSERRGENLYRNVPGNKDQKIFASGVSYFK
ncbi:MAG: phosphoribosylformylglycinamidine synthase [Acutalibacteraceae bacterium]